MNCPTCGAKMEQSKIIAAPPDVKEIWICPKNSKHWEAIRKTDEHNQVCVIPVSKGVGCFPSTRAN